MCCPEVDTILFDPAPGTRCSNITGAYKHSILEHCAYQTCADLLDHKDRHYCGKGDCNIFGCNCDGGCIKIDDWSRAKLSSVPDKPNFPTILRQLFLFKYGDLVTQVYLPFKLNRGMSTEWI